MAIVVPIVADTSGFTRGLTKGSSGIAKFGKVAAIAAGAAGVGALVATVKVGIGEFMQQEKVIAQTNAVLKSTKGVANVTAKEIGKLSESLMKKSGIDDEAIQSGQNLLLTFTKVRNEAGKGNDIFNQATVLMTDLSVAMGKDLNSSAMLVGKALNDPIKGVSALSRAGVQFTQGQKDQIKAMVESGNVMGAQKMILKELETQFGGSAEAAGKTLGGQLNILKETFNNLAGDLVSRFMPGIARAAQALVDFIGKFADAPTLKAKVEVVTGAIGDVWQKVQDWWNKPTIKELPAGLVLIPSGKKQLNDAIEAMFIQIRAAAKEYATATGREIGRWLLRGFTDKGEESGPKAGGHFIGQLFVNTDAMKAAARLVEWLIDGIELAFEESKVSFSDIIKRWLSIPDDSPLRSAYEWGKRLADSAGSGASSRKGKVSKNISNVFTDAFKDAVKSARESLVSGGSSIAGMLSERVSAGFRVDGTGKDAKELIAAQRDLEDRQMALKESNLRDDLAASENAVEAQLALDEFLLQKEATLRQRGVDDANAANTQQINDLIAAFNKGDESAQSFREKLNGIIGAAPGADLGGAFAGAFDTQLQTVLGTAQDIFDTISGSLTLAGGSGLLEALKQSNDERFKAYIQRWESRRDALQDRIDDANETLDDDDSTDKQKNAARARLKKAQDALAAHRSKKKDRAAFGMALGGVLSKQVFTAGEAGPEAVMPLTGRGGVMLRDALGLNGSQGATYNITVNAGMGTSGIDLGREIVAAIKQYERTNGNVFVGA